MQTVLRARAEMVLRVIAAAVLAVAMRSAAEVEQAAAVVAKMAAVGKLAADALAEGSMAGPMVVQNTADESSRNTR